METGAGKMLYCVRHGESTFNEWRKKSLKDFSWLWVRDPMILDAPLSAKGRAQATELNAQVRSAKLDEKVQVIITSPLTRAIETTLYGFEGAQAPVVVDHWCREMLDTACDIGRQPQGKRVELLCSRSSESNHWTPAALQESFPRIDFSSLSSDWWVSPPNSSQSSSSSSPPVSVSNTPKEVLPLRESDEQVDVRIREFIRRLAARPETHIAVVGHSSFFKRMLGMSRKLHNCELYEVQFDELVVRWGR